VAKPMDFTVIICTYNRFKNLSSCIEALEEQQDVDTINWEVLFVDNNSTDKTKETVTELINKSSLKIRYAFEPSQGLNHARNLGIKESKGKYFAYLDDDITVSKNWLNSIYQSLVKNDADATGGRIHLDPEVVLPSWITKNPEMYGFLGFQDYGESPLQVDGIKQYPFGGNMAFSRKVVEQIGFFNTKLGRKGEGSKKNELFKGAETDYFHRLAAVDGVKIFYAPDAIVYHHILPHQLTKNYFLTIHRNAGYQKAFNDNSDYPRCFMGAPLFVFPQVTKAIGKYLFQMATKGLDYAFRQRMTVAHFFGTLSGYFSKHKKVATA